MKITFYYFQLEDDVVAKPGYLTVMKSFAHLQKSNDWLLLEFSTLGFIGKLMQFLRSWWLQQAIGITMIYIFLQFLFAFFMSAVLNFVISLMKKLATYKASL